MRGRRWVLDRDPLLHEAQRAIYDGRPADAYALVRRHRGQGADNFAVAALLLLGRPRRAWRRLGRMRVDEANHALLAALLVLRRRYDEARELLADYPGEYVAGLGGYVVAVAARRRGRDPREVLGQTLADWRVLNGAGTALFNEGAYAEAAEWFARGDHPDHAYNEAGAWARAGDAERGLRALRRAASLGYADGAGADLDEDLALLRAHPGWAAVRARLGGSPASR